MRINKFPYPHEKSSVFGSNWNIKRVCDKIIGVRNRISSDRNKFCGAKSNEKMMKILIVAFLSVNLFIGVQCKPGLLNDLVGTTTGLVLSGLDSVTSGSVIDLLCSTGLSATEIIPYIAALNTIMDVCNEFTQNLPSEWKG